MVEVPISLLLIILMILVLFLAISNYYFDFRLTRNEDVYKFRTSMIDYDYKSYNKFPDYNIMIAYYMIPLDTDHLDDWTNFNYPWTESNIMAAYYYYIKYRADRKAPKP